MKVITIGRSSENDVVISDPYVGRHHCQIIENNGKYSISSINAKNGTYVNGRKINEETGLSDSDIVRIGNTTIEWKRYFATEPVHVVSSVPASSPQYDNYTPNTYNIYNESSSKEVKIDYNEGGFGRKFGQAAGDSAGNVVGCFVGIVIVIIIIIVLGFLLF